MPGGLAPLLGCSPGGVPPNLTVSLRFHSYGAKIRAPHALVMTFLFRSGRYRPASLRPCSPKARV